MPDLKGQSDFTDYDFEGSGMNILLDTLAYNTHYNAFLANMMANEMFLDTAQKRNSVTSHAKTLGYTTTSGWIHWSPPFGQPTWFQQRRVLRTTCSRAALCRSTPPHNSCGSVA